MEIEEDRITDHVLQLSLGKSFSATIQVVKRGLLIGYVQFAGRVCMITPTLEVHVCVRQSVSANNGCA